MAVDVARHAGTEKYDRIRNLFWVRQSPKRQITQHPLFDSRSAFQESVDHWTSDVRGGHSVDSDALSCVL